MTVQNLDENPNHQSRLDRLGRHRTAILVMGAVGFLMLLAFLGLLGTILYKMSVGGESGDQAAAVAAGLSASLDGGYLSRRL